MSPQLASFDPKKFGRIRVRYMFWSIVGPHKLKKALPLYFFIPIMPLREKVVVKAGLAEMANPGRDDFPRNATRKL